MDPQELVHPYRVLVTGFGPFGNYQENPSWLSVQPLQNEILYTDVTTDKIPKPEPAKSPPPSLPSPSNTQRAQPQARAESNISLTPRPIHVSTLQIPMLYEAVLDTIPDLHGRPPVLPPSAPESTLPPPHTAFDFILHTGVAGRGPLRIERVGHKLGYHMKDASGKYASVVRNSPKDFSRRDGGNDHLTTSESWERERISGIGSTGIGGGGVGSTLDSLVSPAVSAETTAQEGGSRPTRGFGGPMYEANQDEYSTDIDCTRMVQNLKRSGVEQIYTSMDAGHYLCDFIYYCSLAEARRSSKPYEKRRTTQVLCLHCCPVNQPLSIEEVTDAIRRIIIWVCNEQQLHDEGDAANVPPA